MAERRMFAKTIVLSDSFLEMPASTRCLYFTLGMLADDDGFVGNPKSIIRQCCATDDDMKLLIAKRFVLCFESGVIVIKHWRLNNYLQNDRKKDTTYIKEKKCLTIEENGAYKEIDSQCIQSVYELDTQDSIDKLSIDKDSINNKPKKNTFTKPTIEEIQAYINEKQYTNVNAEKFYYYYESNGWLVGKGKKMKDWQASVVTWHLNGFDNYNNKTSNNQQKPVMVFEYNWDENGRPKDAGTEQPKQEISSAKATEMAKRLIAKGDTRDGRELKIMIMKGEIPYEPE